MEDRFDDAVTSARKSLIQRPRYALALRVLAASLAMQGQLDEAAAALRKNLDIEAGLTLTTLRARMMFVDEGWWNHYAQGLHAAGLPE